jgi:hypothetical protein
MRRPRQRRDRHTEFGIVIVPTPQRDRELFRVARLGHTLEYIDFSRIRKAGVVNGNMPNWFRQVSADINVPVFVNQGKGSLLVTEGVFNGGSADVAAIQTPATSSGGVVFLRDIDAYGYAAALSTGSDNTLVPGGHLEEYAFPAPTSQFPSRMTSLNLQNIPNTPEYMDSNFSNWASVSSYGDNCTPSSGRDATSCIQSAMNSGKPIIYFPFGDYWSSSTIHVPSSVRVILGMNSQVSSAASPGQYPMADGKHRANYCVFEFDGNGANPVEFRNLNFTVSTQPVGPNAGSVCYNGSAPLVIANSLDGVNPLSTSNSSGDIFLEDVAYPNANWQLKPTQHVYVRQYDVESGPGTHVNVSGGVWWVFGFKSEGSGLLWNVSNSTFELLGTFALAQRGVSPNPAFKMVNSHFSLAGIASTSGGWSVAVSEQQGTTTRNQPVNNLWYGGIGYGLYAGGD